VVLRHSIWSRCYYILRDECRHITASSPLNWLSVRYKSSVADVTPSRFRPLAFSSPVLYETELHWLDISECLLFLWRSGTSFVCSTPTETPRTPPNHWSQNAIDSLGATIPPYPTRTSSSLRHFPVRHFVSQKDKHLLWSRALSCDFQILVLTRRILFDCSIDVFKIHVAF